MTTRAHLFKTARRQMRKIRHRGAHSETERRLLASANLQRTEGLGWRYDGFASFTDAELFESLARFSVQVDAESFKREALSAGSPTALAERWDLRSSAEGKWRDLPALAARELWRRLLPEHRPPEIVADEVDALLEEAEVGTDKPGLWLQAARRLVDACLKDGRADEKFFLAVQRESGSDLRGWMVEMPASLLGTPNAEESPRLCEQFAQLVDRTAMLAERAEILANLGKREQALAQIEALLKESADDPVVQLKAGATYERLGEFEKSQAFLRLYTESMQGPRGAQTIVAAARNGVPLPPPGQTPGPNDKCPCGSGKKFKRCHGLPS